MSSSSVSGQKRKRSSPNPQNEQTTRMSDSSLLSCLQKESQSASFNLTSLKALVSQLRSSTGTKRTQRISTTDPKLKLVLDFQSLNHKNPSSTSDQSASSSSSSSLRNKGNGFRPLFKIWDDLIVQFKSFNQGQNPTLYNNLISILTSLLNLLSNFLKLLNGQYINHDLGLFIIYKLLPSNPIHNQDDDGNQDGIYFNHLIDILNSIDFKSNPNENFRNHTKISFNEPLVLASLRLIRMINEYQDGRWVRIVSEGINWESKTMQKLLTHQKKSSSKKQSKKTSSSPTLSNPDIKTSSILLLLSFLGSSSSSSLTGGCLPFSSSQEKSSSTSSSIPLSIKLDLISTSSNQNQGGSPLTTVLKSLKKLNDSDLITHILLALQNTLVVDYRIPRNRKVLLFNEWILKDLIELMDRKDKVSRKVLGVGEDEDEEMEDEERGEEEEELTLDLIIHGFLISLCTHPGKGICYVDNGWYLRESEEDSKEDLFGNQDEFGLRNQDLEYQKSTKPTNSNTSSKIHNKILLSLLNSLNPIKSILHSNLTIAILNSSPELVPIYLPNCSIMKSIMEIRPSSSWISGVGFLSRVLRIPNSNHLGGDEIEEDEIGKLGLDWPDFPKNKGPPSLKVLIEALIPCPSSSYSNVTPIESSSNQLKNFFNKSLNHQNKLVRFISTELLVRILLRVEKFRGICLERAFEEGELSISNHVESLELEKKEERFENEKERDALKNGIFTRNSKEGRWLNRLNQVEKEAGKRLPDFKNLVDTVWSGRSTKEKVKEVEKKKGKEIEKAQELEEAESKDQEVEHKMDQKDMLLTEMNLRLIEVFQRALPSLCSSLNSSASSEKSGIDVGKLLSSEFMSPDNHHQGPIVNGEDVEMSESNNEESKFNSRLKIACQLHALKIISPFSFSSTSSSNLQQRNLIESFNSIDNNFEIFSKASSGNGGNGPSRSYFCLLLAVYLGSSEPEIKASCSKILTFNVYKSGILGISNESSSNSNDDWEIWRESLPIEGKTEISSSTDSELQMEMEIPDAISEEQACVLVFLDDSAQRCAKNVYRYTESSKTLTSSSSSSSVPPPFLMTFLEQFSIRSKKRILDPVSDEDGQDSSSERITLINFLIRLLLNLVCRDGIELGLVDGLLNSLKEVEISIKEGETLSRGKNGNVEYYFKTLIDFLRCLKMENGSKDVEIRKGKDVRGFASSCQAATHPSALRSLIRSVPRPLSTPDVKSLVKSVSNFQEAGFKGASQIYLELNPYEENLFNSKTQDEGSSKMPPNVWLLHSQAYNQLNPTFKSILELKRLGFGSLSEIESQACTSLILARVQSSVLSDSTSFDQDLQLDISILKSLLVGQDSEDGKDDFTRKVFGEKSGLTSILSNSEIEMSKKNQLLFKIVPLISKVVNASQSNNREMMRGITDQVLLALQHSISSASGTGMEIEGQLSLDVSLNLVEEALIFLNQDQLEKVSRVLVSGFSLQATEPFRSETLLDILRGCVELSSHSPAVISILASQLSTLTSLSSTLSQSSRSALFSLLESIFSREASPVGLTFPQEALSEIGKIDVVELLAFANEDGVDSIVSRLIYQSRALAVKVSAYVNQQLSSNSSSLPNQIPSSIHAYLDVLSKSDESEVVGEGSVLLPALVKSCFDTNPLVSSLACSSFQLLYGLSQKAKTERVALDLLARAVPSTPSQSFKIGFISLVKTIVESTEAPLTDSALTLASTLLDNGLLWLVRRFAEDGEDDSELARAIEVFNSLVRECSKKSIEPKSHLGDPVIEAGIKNRLSETTQMELLRTLVKFSSIKASSLSRHLNAILAHSNFSQVTRRMLEDSDGNDSTSRRDRIIQMDRRNALIRLIHTIVFKDVEKLSSTSASSKLISIYGGTLSSSDRLLFRILSSFERFGKGGSFLSLLGNWSPSVYGSLGSKGENVKAMDALLSLNPMKVMNTCTNFPRARSFSSQASGLDPSVIDEEDPVETEIISESLYDPCLVLSLLGASLAETGCRLSGLQWLSILRSNTLGLAVCSLSSRFEEIRHISASILSAVYAGVSSTKFVEKEHFILILDSLRDSIPSPSDQETDSFPSLPLTITLFIAQVLRSLTAASSFTYPIFSRFLLQRPELDIGDVPLFYNLLNSSTNETHRQERAWILRFLRDVIRSGGRNEWKVLKRRHVWDVICSLYSSLNQQSRLAIGQSNPTVEENIKASKDSIRQILLAAISTPNLSLEVIGRRAFLSWIIQEQSLERRNDNSSTSLFDETSEDEIKSSQNLLTSDGTISTASSFFWIQILERSTRHLDLEDLDSFTSGSWISNSVDILLNSTACSASATTSNPGKLSIWSKDMEKETKTLAMTARMVRRIFEFMRSKEIKSNQRGLINSSILQLFSLLVERCMHLKTVPLSEKALKSHIAEPDEEEQLRLDQGEQKLRESVHHLYEALLAFQDVSDAGGFAFGAQDIRADLKEAFSKVVGLELGFGGEEARELVLSTR